MTRELLFCLILKLFLLICNAQSDSGDVTKEYERNDLKWIDDDIVVPIGLRREITETAPNGPSNKTKIDIEMSAVEIINFDVKLQQFTIRMGLKINWSEKRLLLINSSLVNGWVEVYGAWFPQIDIRSVVVLESRKKKPIEVSMDSKSEVSKWIWDYLTSYYLVQSFSAKMTFSLTTTIKCSMDFEMFPFDSHICKLEVSSLSNEYR